MARVKFGEVIGMVKLPPPEVHQQIPQTLQADPMELVQKVMDMLPKPKEIEHQDLGYLERAISSQADRLMEHKERLESLEKKKECSCAPLALPEVKQITHVKDVSKEVMEHVNANKQKFDGDLMNHANHIVAIETKLKNQKTLNLILIGALILTIFLHLK